MIEFSLDKNVRSIAVYGANLVGSVFKTYMDEMYPDVELKYFVDINAKRLDTFYGHKNITPEEFFPIANEVDLVVIAAYRQSSNIKHILKGNGIENYCILDKDFEIKYVQSLLDSQKEKDLFRLVYCAKRINTSLTTLEYTNENLNINCHGYTDDRQYFEYVNMNAVKTALDCGGNNGYTSIVFQHEFPNIEKIYCFEPLYKKFATFIPGLEEPSYFYKDIIDRSKKIEIVEKGVWNKEETLEFYENTKTPGGSSAIQDRVGESNCLKTVIQTTTIDKFKEENKIEKIDYIKMDIESAELKALVGAEKTIKSDRPQLAISIYHSLQEYVSIPVYLKKICKDYEFHVGHYSRTLCETVFYAIPKELAQK